MMEMDRDLLRLFSTNVSIAFKNLDLNIEIIETQKEVIYTLGEVVETHSQEAANHVKRVAEVSWLLAIKSGLGEERAEIIRLASPMHDIGKVGVPEAILTMPGKPTPEEFEKIKPHAVIGYDILRKSRRELMEAAAVIAHRHHERWDGTGYPDGIAGEDIHIYARITGLADVFDALSHRRVYKEPWSSADVYALILNERGKHFDPHLVDIFLENFDDFLAINDMYPAK
jgi:response regulator RpfG family c-di-GMP phosphodiesterase